MVLEREKYAVCRAPIKHWLETKKFTDLDREMSMIALATSAPIIIVVEFVMEVLGRTEHLVARQKELMHFYHIKEIV